MLQGDMPAVLIAAVLANEIVAFQLPVPCQDERGLEIGFGGGSVVFCHVLLGRFFDSHKPFPYIHPSLILGAAVDAAVAHSQAFLFTS